MHLPLHLRDRWYFLARHFTKREFMEVIERVFPNDLKSVELIERMYDVTEAAYFGQHRDSGERTFVHSQRCALILVLYRNCRDASMIAAMLGHDLGEDGPENWPVERITAEFNLRVAKLIAGMSKPQPRETLRTDADIDSAYHEQLAIADADVIELKIVDRLDNLITLWARTFERMRAKVVETRMFILPLARKYNILVRELEAVLTHLERHLDVVQM